MSMAVAFAADTESILAQRRLPVEFRGIYCAGGRGISRSCTHRPVDNFPRWRQRRSGGLHERSEPLHISPSQQRKARTQRERNVNVSIVQLL